MKALLLRNLRAYRTFFLLMFLIMLLYTYLNLRLGSVDGITGFLVVFIPSITGVVLFLGDYELMPLFASMPVSRRDLVLSKYFSTYLIGGTLLFATLLILWILSFYYTKARADFLLLLSPKGFAFAIMPITFIVSISYPLLFRYGLQLGVKLVLMSFAFLYGFGMIVAEKILLDSLNLSRRGIFVAFMGLFELGETQVGAMPFYTAIYLILGTLIVGSIWISVQCVKTKDIQ